MNRKERILLTDQEKVEFLNSCTNQDGEISLYMLVFKLRKEYGINTYTSLKMASEILEGLGLPEEMIEKVLNKLDYYIEMEYKVRKLEEDERYIEEQERILKERVARMQETDPNSQKLKVLMEILSLINSYKENRS